jgi:hypothetical protein
VTSGHRGLDAHLRPVSFSRIIIAPPALIMEIMADFTLWTEPELLGILRQVSMELEQLAVVLESQPEGLKRRASLRSAAKDPRYRDRLVLKTGSCSTASYSV